MYIYTTPTLSSHPRSHSSFVQGPKPITQLWSKQLPCCTMASRWSFLPLPWLPLLLAVLGDAVAAVSVPRPLLGIAEPPASAPRPNGGGRPDRSVAGADVILVGFAAAVVVVIFLYIRVTRKNSSSVVGVGEKQEGSVGPHSELKI